METNIPADSSSSLGNLSLSDGDMVYDDEGGLQNDTWIEELECALLADCDLATLKKICEGKRIPSSLRPDYWRTLLALNDTGNVKLSNEFDLPNQNELRHDCELLVEDISANLSTEPLADSDKLRLKSDFESTLTTYVKARPELHYVSGNGWTDILRVLYNLQLDDAQMYQMFFRIVDRYIPKDLYPCNQNHSAILRDDQASINQPSGKLNAGNPKISSKSTGPDAIPKSTNDDKMKHQPQTDKKQSQRINNQMMSTQAYHLLRLLIQYHDPELCSILDSKKVTPNLYVKDWFCSLFARSCPKELALHMWDMHFKMADPFLIFFAAIVMVVNASDELKKSNLSQEDMLNALKKMPSLLQEDDIEDLYYLVSNHYTNSTPRSIRAYSHLFFMDTFGATYSGNESPELGGSPPLVDLKTCRLTSSLDLSQYLCLPIVPAEIFALETGQQRASPVESSTNDNVSSASDSPSRSPTATALRYFLVDCRPAEQYNAGHLTKAFHLDCSLMLSEPSTFATAVRALLEIQRQVVASKSNTGGQHLCFIGSGQEEEDRYVNMVVASFLQKYQKYVSIVHGGFDAIHDYVKTKSELCVAFDKYIVDHNEEFCKACCSKNPEAFERLQAHSKAKLLQNQQQQPANSFSKFTSAQSLFASGFFGKNDKTSALGKFSASNPQTTAAAHQLAQSGVSMFDKLTSAFVSKSSTLKERLVETLNNTSLPSASMTSPGASTSPSARGHVSSQDKLGPRYMGSNNFMLDNRRDSTELLSRKGSDAEPTHDEEPCQEIQMDQWQRENNIMALYKCAQIRGTNKYPGYLGLNKTHLWILREIPHNKGFASIAAKRPLDMIVQITSKRRQPDLIIFRYGHANSTRSTPSPVSARTQAASLDDNSAQSISSNEQQQQQSSGKCLPTVIASDHLHIPQAFEVIRVIKREVVRIMDESSRANNESRDHRSNGEDKSNTQSVMDEQKQTTRVSESESSTKEIDTSEGDKTISEQVESCTTDDQKGCTDDRTANSSSQDKEEEREMTSESAPVSNLT